MAAQTRLSAPIRQEGAFDMRSLRQLAFWGLAASGALLLAVLTGFSATREAPAQARKADAQRSAEPDPEVRRVTEIVHVLAADRERLVVRLAAIERNLEDITGTIKRQEPASPPPAASAPPPAAAAVPPTPLALAPAAAAPEVRAATRPAEPPPVTAIETVEEGAPEIIRTEIGVDVGGATNFEGLRTLWFSTRGATAAPLDGLYPVVAVRENSRTSSPELRLLVGPLPNVEAAARLCATLVSARRYCQPVAFEGQRLADADGAPDRKPTGRAAQAKPAPKQAPAQQQPATQQRLLPRLF